MPYYCDVGHPFIMVVSKDHAVILTPVAKRFGSGAVPTCINNFGLLWLLFEHQTFDLQGERSY